MVLGYFGRTPVEPDPEIVKLASEQLDKPVFNDDPLDLLEPGTPKAAAELKKHNLPETEENLFIASSCEEKGIDFLLGKAKTSIRKKSDETAKEVPVSGKSTAPNLSGSVESLKGPRDYTITVDGKTYQVQVNTGENLVAPVVSGNTPDSTPVTPQISRIDIPAPTPGNIVRLEVEVGETIVKEQTLLVMEAMKMESEVKSPQAGVVQGVHVQTGNTVQTGDTLITLNA